MTFDAERLRSSEGFLDLSIGVAKTMGRSGSLMGLDIPPGCLDRIAEPPEMRKATFAGRWLGFLLGLKVESPVRRVERSN